MKNLISMLKKAFRWFHNEFHGKVEDRYVLIPAAPTLDAAKTGTSFALTDQLPDLGEKRDFFINKAEQLFTRDTDRLKWILAQHKMMQSTETEWIMKPMTSKEFRELNRRKEKQFQKWGLTSVGT